jgi:hypothetical protein
LQDIGTIADFNQGFTDTALALITNVVYATLNNASLQIKSTDSAYTPAATITPVTHGAIETTPLTSIDLKGYSGIDKITLNGTGGKYAISFDKGVTLYTPDIDSYVKSLLHFDGNFNDITGRIWTPGTGAKIVTDIYKFGSGAMGSTAGALTTPITDDINLGTRDFTIEWWEYRLALGGGTGAYPMYINTAGYPAVSGDLGWAADTRGTWYAYNAAFVQSYSKLNQWSHCALVRNGGMLTSYQDGAIVSSHDVTGLNFNSTGIATICGVSTYAIIDEFRLSLDVARYTGSTYTVPDAAFGQLKQIEKIDLSTNGGTLASVNSLTKQQLAPIFQRTQLDIYGALSGSDVLTTIDLLLPENIGPVISNINVTPDTMHKENVTLTADLSDAEGDTFEYRVLVNAEEYQPWSVSNSVNIVFPDSIFNVGMTSIKIEARDSRGIISNKEIFVTRINTNPVKITGVLSGRVLDATLGDADNDDMTYRIKVNGVYKTDWSALSSSPVTVHYQMSPSDIMMGQINNITVEFKDSLGGEGTSYIEEFIGDYYGLMFTDEGGNYLTTDLGDLLKYLDFGIIVAGYDSVPKEVKVINKTKYPISSITITGPKDINGKDHITYDVNGNINGTVHIEGDIYAKLSIDDTFLSAVDVLSIKDLNSGESASFYVKIISSSKKSEGDFIFNVAGAGKTTDI